MAKQENYDVRDSQIWHQRWSKRLNITLEMVKQENYDVRDSTIWHQRWS